MTINNNDTNGLRSVEAADLFRLKFVESASLSPDGSYVAYTVLQVDAEKEKQTTALWIVALDSGEARQMTSNDTLNGNPQWSPDGKRIAFTSTRGEKPQIYVMPVDGGEAQALTSLKQGVGGGPVWSPDGQFIAFTAISIAESRDPAKPYRVTRHVYRFDAVEYLDDCVQSIYVVAAVGGDPRQVTNDKCMNVAPQWSPDGKELLYLATMLPDIHDTFLPRLRVVNLVDGAIRDVLGDWGHAAAAAWLPDGQRIAFIGTPNRLPIGSKSDVWIVSRQGGQPERRTEGIKVGVGGSLQGDLPLMSVLIASPTFPISKDGHTAYVPVQEGGTVQAYRVALDGPESHESILNGDRSCQLFAANDRHLVYRVSGINQPDDLYISDIEGANERPLTKLNDDVLSHLKLPTVERLQFSGSDGIPVEGWFIAPQGVSKPYPTILYIHGGPHGAFGHIYHFDTQLLCGAGYAVLMVNHRASTGYGDEFSTAIKGDWGNLDYNDLMAGVDYAIAQGLADPDRLGVCGLSGGGNLTCWVVGHTGRFKAAVPENPVTNWVSFYGVSDIGPWFAVEEMGGRPYEIPEVYAKCSPITYAHHCTTPTLMIQGEHDWRCPAEQSEQFYSVLKANGCTVEMLRLPNSSHNGTLRGEPVIRRVHNEALLDWMNRYVMGKESPGDKSPG